MVRERVLAALSVDRRFTLVSAMPGYGKTAAVRHWIDTVDLPVAWLSLDLLDLDPLSFWSHVLGALASAHPGIDDEPALLLWERGPDDALFLGALASRLADLDTPILLVLDGLPEQLDRSAVDGLALLVERAGDTLRTVVTARADPPLPLPRWHAAGQLGQVREETLRLTDDEALAIGRAAATAINDADELTSLNHHLDGWPIGFHMALLSRPRGRASTTFSRLSPTSSRLLASYLATEVLEAMSTDEREVALALCVLEQFDADMAEQIAGPQAADAVRGLLQRGMFLSVVDPRTGLMRFHDLFRELMETELGFRDPVARVERHRRAALLWRARGDLTSAYHHLAAIGETGKARELLVGPTMELVDRGDLDELHRFARKLPARQHVTSANLALDLALVALYADGTHAARLWCDRAEALAGDDGEDGKGEMAQRLLGLRCAIALSDADLDTALSRIDDHRIAPGDAVDTFERRLPLVAARVMLAARRKVEADEWITVAERTAEPGTVTEATLPTLRAWHEWMFGSLRRALSLVDGALAWIDEHQVRRQHLAFDTLTTGGWCRLSTGDIASAMRLADRAWTDAELLGCAWNQLQAGHLRARLALVMGEPARALQLVDELRDTVPFDSCHSYADRLRAIEIEALAAAGRTHDARDRLTSLDPGPRRLLLSARFAAISDREVDKLLGDRDGWRVIDRLQAELLLSARCVGEPPSHKLIELVADGAEDGWVLPFLGMGPRVERLLREIPLGTVHPQLERTLDLLAPPLPTDAGRAGIRLTSRELTLLELLPTHLTKAEIGERLFLSVNTVKSNLRMLYRKLDATTRAEAIEAARRAGLL